jgi:OmpA-OmpF porin, OOP family
MFTRQVGWLPRCLGILLLAAAGVLGDPGSSQAETGFALDRFDPSERGSHWFFADSLDIRGSGRWAFGVIGDFAHEPLVLRDSNGDEVAQVVSAQFFLHLGGSVVLADRLRFGLNLPILVYQNAFAVQGPTGLVSPRESATLGELRVGTDLRLFGYGGDPFTLGLGVRAYFPTGSRAAFTGSAARLAWSDSPADS